MKNQAKNIAGGVRWLMLCALPPDVRAQREAAEWLSGDPLFAPPVR